MKHLPIAFRGIINIFLFVLYVLLVSFAFSFLFPIMLQIFGAQILDPSNPVFAKIQIFIILLVLVVSVILRKYFYIPLYVDKKEVVIHTKTISDDEGLDIKIEKEIK